jgi:hypothetical protein
MSTKYSITVTNNSPNAQEFFFFQQPAVYSGGSKVYTNSIGHGGLPPMQSGRSSQIQFTVEQQFYAGAQKQNGAIIVGQAQIGLVSQVAIDLADPNKQTYDCTNVVLNDSSLYLTSPAYLPGVQNGAFRIMTPTYNPQQYQFLVGLSTINNDGDIILSNFIPAEPTKNIDVQPIVKFYISTGSYTAGTVVNFTTSSQDSAVCDATNGKLSFKVTYNADGTWNVE